MAAPASRRISLRPIPLRRVFPRYGASLYGLRARHRRLWSRVGIRTLHEGLGKRIEERQEDIDRKSDQERQCERRYRGGLSEREVIEETHDPAGNFGDHKMRRVCFRLNVGSRSDLLLELSEKLCAHPQQGIQNRKYA